MKTSLFVLPDWMLNYILLLYLSRVFTFWCTSFLIFGVSLFSMNLKILAFRVVFTMWGLCLLKCLFNHIIPYHIQAEHLGCWILKHAGFKLQYTDYMNLTSSLSRISVTQNKYGLIILSWLPFSDCVLVVSLFLCFVLSFFFTVSGNICVLQSAVCLLLDMLF